MKKIGLILLLCFTTCILYSQVVYKRDVTITKTTPTLKLDGLGGLIQIDGSTSGTTTITAPDVAGSSTVTMPSYSGTLAKQRIFDVTEYGADPTGSSDATTEIQAAIDAASAITNYRAAVYFPRGIYLISDTLEITGDVNGYGIDLFGDGFSSRIYNNGTTASLYLKDLGYCKIKDLHFKGNGGAFGAGGTTGEGIILDGAMYMWFENVYVFNHGSHGINLKDDAWGNKFTDCWVQANLGDGINAINTLSEGSSNANALSLINCNLRSNADDGIEWAGGTGFNINGCTFENNKGSGVQIGSKSTVSNSTGISIQGSYFEENDSAQIYIVAQQYDNYYIYGLLIEGNYISDAGVDAVLDALIKHDGGGDYYSLANSYIGKNHYYKSGATVVYNVRLENPRPDVIVDLSSGFYTYSSNYQDAYSVTEYMGVIMSKPIAANVTAANGVTASMLYPEIYFSGSSAIDITANPQIVAGFIGQRLKIWGNSDTNTLTLDDGTGLKLNGNAQCVLGVDDVIELEYRSNGWCELYRSNN